MNLDAIDAIPKNQRLLIQAIIFAAVIGLFFFYPYRSNSKQIGALAKQIEELDRQIVVNKSLAEKKDELLAKNAELQDRLLDVQRKLPTTSEVTDLLKQVSVLGQQSGLDFRLWKPRNKMMSSSSLYYEIPVEIELTGGYHEVALFFDRVSKLSRIVNITDLSMAKSGGDKDIITKCVAKTFSALDEQSSGLAQNNGGQ